MNELQFPKGFFWGAATSAHQVEGDNFNNDWWEAERKGLVPYQSGKACDHYNLFSQDFDLAQSLGHNAHRFSIEWSRIEPEPGKFNEQAAIHYRRMILYLRDRGMEPIVTLHHFTNPKWFANFGGWANIKAPKYFSRYVKFCLDQFGDYVNWWVTINEPRVYAGSGYLLGQWPPFKKSPWLTIKVLHNMARAHRRAYKLIKSRNRAQVSFAHNMAAYLPAHKHNFIEKIAARIAKFFANDYFLKLVHNHYDFLGLNFYFTHRVHIASGIKKYIPINAEVSDMGWEINPAGLLQVLRELKKYNKPIIITENGIADKNDDQRWSFIIKHLLMIYSALSEGINIKGYLYWSLLDNFEWAEGFEPRFGLIEIDYKTQKRIVRPSAWEYAKVIRDNAISFDSIAQIIAQRPQDFPSIFKKFEQKINRINPTT